MLWKYENLQKVPKSDDPNISTLRLLETDAKKIRLVKILPLVKNPQFLSNQADIQAIVPTHGLVILTKFHKDWQKINDFLVITKFWASPVFFASVSIIKGQTYPKNSSPGQKCPSLFSKSFSSSVQGTIFG